MTREVIPRDEFVDRRLKYNIQLERLSALHITNTTQILDFRIKVVVRIPTDDHIRNIDAIDKSLNDDGVSKCDVLMISQFAGDSYFGFESEEHALLWLLQV